MASGLLSLTKERIKRRKKSHRSAPTHRKEPTHSNVPNDRPTPFAIHMHPPPPQSPSYHRALPTPYQRPLRTPTRGWAWASLFSFQRPSHEGSPESLRCVPALRLRRVCDSPFAGPGSIARLLAASHGVSSTFDIRRKSVPGSAVPLSSSASRHLSAAC